MVHFSLASHADAFSGLVFHRLPTGDERRVPISVCVGDQFLTPSQCGCIGNELMISPLFSEAVGTWE